MKIKNRQKSYNSKLLSAFNKTFADNKPFKQCNDSNEIINTINYLNNY